MDDSQEGVLLITASMIVLSAFAIAVFAVMAIYRKRKVQYETEILAMNEKFARELLERQLEVRLQTMKHIGFEIHDDVAQQMTLAYLNLQKVSAEQKMDYQDVQEVAALIDKALTDLRNLSRNLTDPDIMSKDLSELISLECEKIKSSEVFKINYTCTIPEIEMSVETKGITVRILQEFLQNSIRHSGCETVDVGLTYSHSGILLTASDNGKGFDVKRHIEGIGLRSMQNRASNIQALFNIESTPGVGTSMQLVIPSSKITLSNGAPHHNRG